MKCKYYSKIQCDLCFDIKDSTSCCKDCIKLAICEDVCIYWKKHIEDEVKKNDNIIT